MNHPYNVKPKAFDGVPWSIVTVAISWWISIGVFVGWLIWG